VSENAAASTPPPSPGAPPVPDARSADRLRLIYEVGRAALSKIEVGDLLNTIAEAVQRHFGYLDVSIFLLDTAEEECVLVARAGAVRNGITRGYRQKMDAGIVGWVARHGQTVRANDVRQDARYLGMAPDGEGLLSELAVPVRLQGRTLGVIDAQKREVGAFDDADVVALETLSDQVAQAIANVQLFEQTRLLLDLNRSIINAMPSGLCVLDGRHRILFASPAFGEMFDCDSDRVKGQSLAGILPAALYKEGGVEEAIRRALDRSEKSALTDAVLPGAKGDRLLIIHAAPAEMPEGAGVLLVFEDVTEWRRAASLAEQRRRMLDLIVAHVPVAVASMDLLGRFTFWGSAARRLFGYAEAEMLGRAAIQDIVENREAFRKALERCQTTGGGEAELNLRRKDGTTLPALLFLGRLLDEGERHVGYTAVVIDTTERRRAEDDLLREKQKLEHVVEVIGAGLALIDRDHRILWANRMIKEWFVPDGKVEGKFCHEVYCHRGSACVSCPSQSCFSTSANHESEVTLIRADGAMRQYHHAVTPVFGPDGRVDHVLKLTLDVTDETKKVYQLSRLRQLGELMQGVLDLDRLLHFVLTCVTAGQALGFNRALLFLVDRDRNLLEGRMGVGPASGEEAGRIWSQISRESPTLEDLLARYEREKGKPPSPLDVIARGMSISLEDQGHIVAQCALGRKPVLVDNAEADGRVREEFRRALGLRQFLLMPLVAHNEPVGVIVADNPFSGQAITSEHIELLSMFANQVAIAIQNAESYHTVQAEKRHLEQAYRDLADAQDRLVRSERLVAIGRMATHVAHEIRNPLVTIGGFANTILNRPDAPREQVARYVQIIASEVRRLENILARVMDFTRPPKPLLRQSAVNGIVQETVEQVTPVARRQQIAISLDLSGAQPPAPLQLDPEQIKQVCLNLIQNALDAMPNGGKLGVAVRNEPDHVAISVANTGEPIRPEDVAKIFEPFFTTKPGGTGLGLAVSQKIIQDHGGDIRLLSSMDRGTEFVVVLPRNRKPGTGFHGKQPG
jgi:PAS domain S-box-containing protein